MWVENATGHFSPNGVNPVVDSPQFGIFSFSESRAVTARIRIIESKK